MENSQFEKIYNQLVKEARDFKDVVSSFKTVGDVQNEIKCESELFKDFQHIQVDNTFYDDDRDILALAPDKPIDYIRFETAEPDFESEERRELVKVELGQFFVDYPTYSPKDDSLDFDISFEGEEYPIIEDLSLSDEELSRLKRELKEYIDSIEEEIEEEI